jgi:hypothetical protein
MNDGDELDVQSCERQEGWYVFRAKGSLEAEL